jgi:hypothetical protein
MVRPIFLARTPSNAENASDLHREPPDQFNALLFRHDIHEFASGFLNDRST